MDLVWPATTWALWVATLAAAFKVSGRDRTPQREPRHPAPAPVAELLRGMRVQDVFHSALFELAGRGWAIVEGDRLSLAPRREEPLLPYERWVLDQVGARMGGAPRAPVIALMPDGQVLDREFLPLVRQRAIDLGLARRRWSSMLVPVLLACALVVPWFATVAAAGLSWPGMIATMVSFVAGSGLLLAGRGFLLTPAGREVAGPGQVEVNPQQEWIFTGSGWHGVEIVPAATIAQGGKRQEIGGHVVKRWIEVHGDSENSYHIAVHDGSSEKAVAFRVKQGVYQDVLPGDSVRLLVRPRSGAVVRLLAHERQW
ncbi:hypothetical protein E1295_20615 [Nonomuraea mesophila]|uniref:DUF2207 domain-containing protein n=1 Tax=Nonomuraea mesophila TaxID=2530382 RepID=A0A4R5FF11_9ACTN|nr:hypothetical protein [Nonomuraea mesophila]TDE49025.1 hypothetical protein E1295_20615 [Nonomuraea mesophila]